MKPITVENNIIEPERLRKSNLDSDDNENFDDRTQHNVDNFNTPTKK